MNCDHWHAGRQSSSLLKKTPPEIREGRQIRKRGSMSTDNDSDDSNLMSSFQDMLTESFGRQGQRFKETWKTVMIKSRVN